MNRFKILIGHFLLVVFITLCFSAKTFAETKTFYANVEGLYKYATMAYGVGSCKVGKTTDGDIHRGYISWDISGLPPNITITSASLTSPVGWYEDGYTVSVKSSDINVLATNHWDYLTQGTLYQTLSGSWMDYDINVSGGALLTDVTNVYNDINDNIIAISLVSTNAESVTGAYFDYSGGTLVVTYESDDTQAPTVPENFKITKVEPKSMTLSWSASADASGIKHYKIYKNGAYYITTTATTYTVGSLEECTLYNFKVLAVDNNNISSEFSDVKSGTTTSFIEVVKKCSTNVSGSSIELKAQQRIEMLPGFRYQATSSYMLKTMFEDGCAPINKSASIAGISAETDINIIDNVESISDIFSMPSYLDLDKEFRVYPNPTDGDVNIEYYNKLPVEVQLYDFSGSLLYSDEFNQNEFIIDLKDKSSGIYYLKLVNGENIITRKVVKN